MNSLKNTIYLVGGAVRDQLLGIESKDKDYVVVGVTAEQMLALGFEQVGKDFPVFLHPETKEEYALARKETKTGNGYTGFSFDTTNVSLQEDLHRRDLTINAMALNTETNQLIDPFNGQHDLRNKIIKHVSHFFADDPVRILRAARFSARYDFSIHPDTKTFMHKMVESGEAQHLTQERILKEFDKTFSESFIPNFFQTLADINLLNQLGNFKTAISNLQYFNHLSQEYGDSPYLKQSLFNFAFQDFSKTELRNFKLEAKVIQHIELFQQWNGFNYSTAKPQEQLLFIKQTKSIHNTEQAMYFLNFIDLYSSNDTKPNTDLILRHLQNLKQIDYSNINNPALIQEAQLSALTNPSPIKPKM